VAPKVVEAGSTGHPNHKEGKMDFIDVPIYLAYCVPPYARLVFGALIKTLFNQSKINTGMDVNCLFVGEDVSWLIHIQPGYSRKTAKVGLWDKIWVIEEDDSFVHPEKIIIGICNDQFDLPLYVKSIINVHTFS
jgi:hypothetical protein